MRGSPISHFRREAEAWHYPSARRHARTQVQQYEQQYRQTVDQAKQQATQAADTAAKAVSRAGLFGAISLLLGAVAGWFGGRMGAVEPTLTARMANAVAGTRRTPTR